jgi:hypothetical protein
VLYVLVCVVTAAILAIALLGISDNSLAEEGIVDFVLLFSPVE